jgi:8-oxo-dGTP pyrophosphatase MutT (NUDIX family)
VSAWKPPSVTVAAVIEQAGKFLVVEEDYDGKRVLNQPAGHLDPGESLVSACAREVVEETAHRFEPTALIGIYRWYYAPRDITFLRFAFTGELRGFEVDRALDKEIIATHWMSRDELVTRSAELRTPLVLLCLDDYLAGRRYPLDLLIDHAEP